jgi:hypothetical protein
VEMDAHSSCTWKSKEVGSTKDKSETAYGVPARKKEVCIETST